MKVIVENLCFHSWIMDGDRLEDQSAGLELDKTIESLNDRTISLNLCGR